MEKEEYMTKKEIVEVVTQALNVLVVPRLDRIESKQVEHDEKFKQFLGYFDKIFKEIGDLKQEYHMIQEGLRRIEGRLDKIEVGVMGYAEIEKDLFSLKSKVASLQEKIEKVEAEIKK